MADSDNRILVPPSSLDPTTPALTQRSRLPARLNASPDETASGLAKLVLTLVELIRQLLEREAVRRMERGTLSDTDIERVGTAFILLQAKIDELREFFGLAPEDLNIDLGPLGKVL